MRILITSDIHGDLEKLKKLQEIETFDLHLDAGDSNFSEGILKTRQIVSVRGNTDFFSQLPLIKIIENEYGKIVIIHGHTKSVKSSLDYLYQLGERLRANYVIYGHTHQALIKVNNGITYINPGSLKHDSSYIILTKDNIELRSLT